MVQRFVHNYAADHLNNNDILSALKAKIHEVAFTGGEQEGEAFTFAWQNDAAGLPIVGNGSDDKPFVIGVTTKTPLLRAGRDPSSFVFHVDATYKLCQAAYPVLVVGILDEVRTFHVVAIVVMSQQMQLHYAMALSAIRCVYLLVMGKPLVVRYVMSDVAKAQRNVVTEVFGAGSNVVHLMCFFHVAKKIYEKAKRFSPQLFAKVLQDVHDLHFTTSSSEYEEKMTSVFLNWAKWPELSRFTTYFRST